MTCPMTCPMKSRLRAANRTPFYLLLVLAFALGSGCSSENKVTGSNAVAVKKNARAALGQREEGNVQGARTALPVPEHPSLASLPGVTQPLVRLSTFETLANPPVQGLAAAARPAPVVLDAQALTVRMVSVFGTGGRANSQSIDAGRIEQGQIFSPRQRQILGDYNLMGNAQTFRSTQRRTVDQEYIQTLRDYLADACFNLVSAEMANPKSPSNRLVADPSLDAARVSAFMTSLYGFAPASGKLHEGAERYAETLATLASKMPASGGERTNAIRNNSIVLCVTLGSDPRVYLR